MPSCQTGHRRHRSPPLSFSPLRECYCLRTGCRVAAAGVTPNVFLRLAEIGLVLLLFTDASRTDLSVLRKVGTLPGRLLSTGMLLTVLLGAIVARLVFPGLSIWEAGILSAILAPTDAGLGQVVVTSPRVPMRVREGLNVEAGLNDGLSVPFLLFFMAIAAAKIEGGAASLLQYMGEQLGLGVVVGIAVGLVGRLVAPHRRSPRLARRIVSTDRRRHFAPALPAAGRHG